MLRRRHYHEFENFLKKKQIVYSNPQSYYNVTSSGPDTQKFQTEARYVPWVPPQVNRHKMGCDSSLDSGNQQTQRADSQVMGDGFQQQQMAYVYPEGCQFAPVLNDRLVEQGRATPFNQAESPNSSEVIAGQVCCIAVELLHV